MSTTLRHRQELQRLTPVLDSISGLRWCLIKWTDDGRHHGDLDILIGPENQRARLAKLDGKLQYHGYHYDPDPDRYRRKYVHPRLGTEVDIHTAAAWVGIEYLPADWILDTAARERVGDVLVPRPSDEADLLIWAAHDMRSNAIKHPDVAYCRRLADRADVHACRALAAYHGWRPQFDAFLRTIDYLAATPAPAPESAFPFHLPARTSLWLKARKALGRVRRGEVVTAADELWQLARFDVLRWFR